MTIRPPSCVELLVRKSRRALELEARALRARWDEYASSMPTAGCPCQADALREARAAGSALRQLLALDQQEAVGQAHPGLQFPAAPVTSPQ